ncbi:hypothetical protein VNO77_41537 [Canavalia gladiata]|uniref:Uncharacterized protein n=1 Tax=Canavalia gladiata TaxID=3824 RepID=A0AAN9JZ65_CANGL
MSCSENFHFFLIINVSRVELDHLNSSNMWIHKANQNTPIENWRWKHVEILNENTNNQRKHEILKNQLKKMQTTKKLNRFDSGNDSKLNKNEKKICLVRVSLKNRVSMDVRDEVSEDFLESCPSPETLYHRVQNSWAVKVSYKKLSEVIPILMSSTSGLGSGEINVNTIIRTKGKRGKGASEMYLITGLDVYRSVKNSFSDLESYCSMRSPRETLP